MVLLPLQAKLRDREMDNPFSIDGEAIPLHQDVEQRQREAQPRVERGPGAVAHLFEVTHGREHRQHRFDHHPHVLRAASAQLHVRRITRFGMKARVGQDDHLVAKLGNQRLEGVISDVGRRIIPGHNQAILIDEVGQLGSNDPAMVRQTLAANLPVGAVFAPRMAQLNAVTIDDTEGGRLREKDLGPVRMGGKQAKQARAFRQAGKPALVVVVEPPIERARADAFERKQQGQRDDLARIQVGLRSFGRIGHDRIDPNEQGHDKIVGRHANLHW